MQSGSLKCRRRFMLHAQILIRIPCSVGTKNFLCVLKALSLLVGLVFNFVGLLYIMNGRETNKKSTRSNYSEAIFVRSVCCIDF